jgi:uncharacterized protein (TIGR03086 family)
MDPREQLTHILPTITKVVDGIEPQDLNKATPCAKFDVHDVLNHMIVLGGAFAYSFRGEEPPDIVAPETSGRVPAAEFRQAMDDLLEAVNSPGAMERTVTSPVGEMPGETFARLVAFDGLVHGWDLASATGSQYHLPSEVISAVDEFARSALTPEMRDGDTFKQATTPPADAGPIERVVAFSGRTV